MLTQETQHWTESQAGNHQYLQGQKDKQSNEQVQSDTTWATVESMSELISGQKRSEDMRCFTEVVDKLQSHIPSGMHECILCSKSF